MTKGEKIVKRNEKRLEKERKRAIQEANKMLIPTPKQTEASFGILSFDPSSTFRLRENRWVRVFEIIGSKETESDFFAKMISSLKGRARVTAKIGGNLKQKGFISLMEQGEIYSEVRKDMEMDQEALSSIFILRPLTIDETMMEIMGEGAKPFSYASMVRGKKDWKEECVPKIHPSPDSFYVNDSYGECLFIKQFPSIYPLSLTDSLKNIGCLMYLSIDFRGISVKESQRQSLEQRYNRRLFVSTEKEFLNASVTISYICDSDDARQIIEKTLKRMFSREGFDLVTSYGAQKEAFESVVTLGILDYCNMRNVDLAAARDLIVSGGGLCL